MRIAQVLLPDASEYERKSQRIDFAELGREHELVDERDAEVVHVYGRDGKVGRAGRRWLRRLPQKIVTPVKDAPNYVPEAVEDRFFDAPPLRDSQRVGVYVRRSVEEMLDRTRARVARTRDDVAWRLFRKPPTPEEMAEISVWFDPATREDDFDGFVAEALAASRIVVATRTAINVQRLEKGRTGMLVPLHDANEATHAILAALFKPEAGRPRAEAAAQTISKFRPRQRMRVLTHLYETLIR